MESIPRPSKQESIETTKVVPELTIGEFAPELTEESREILANQWEKFWELRRATTEGSGQKDFSIKKGFLTHHAWNTDNLSNILRAGIVSGELGFGEKETVAEDAETHYCADFFVSEEDRDVSAYVEFIGTKEKTGVISKPRGESYARPSQDNDRIAFVVDPNQPGLEKILAYSGTGVEKGELDRFPVRFPHEKANHLAVLVGVPANFISYIIVGGKLKDDEARLAQLKSEIASSGLNIPLVDTSGTEII